LAEKAAGGGGRRRGAPQALKTLGDHPDGGAVTVHSGRYGPYVKHGKINATIPKDTKPEDVTMEQAIELIAARAAKTGKKPTAKKKAPAKKKATAKKATAKKPAKKAASAE
jgi:DNA topoisomerase-1